MIGQNYYSQNVQDIILCVRTLWDLFTLHAVKVVRRGRAVFTLLIALRKKRENGAGRKSEVVRSRSERKIGS